MSEYKNVKPLSERRPLLLAYLLTLVFWVLSIGTFWGPLRHLLLLSLSNVRYTHLVVIPFISASLLWWNRREIFRSTARDPRLGIPLFLLAIAAAWWASSRVPSERMSTDEVSFLTLAVLTAFTAGFLLFYGRKALRAARFPLLFLLLMIPLPQFLMDNIVRALQVGTSAVLYSVFSLAGTPLYSNGLTFELPGVGILIGEESTSIRSLSVLFILSILVGHFFLMSRPLKVVLSGLTLPIATLTNAVRILTIWFLATHVDISYLNGKLHHHGGILFSLISVCNLLLCLWMLQKFEHRGAAGSGRRAEAESPLASMLSDWSDVPSLTSFSCQLTFGKVVSYQTGNKPPIFVKGLLERATNRDKQSLRFFVHLDGTGVSPEEQDRVTIDGISCTVSAVQREIADGAWLSLRAVGENGG